MSSEDDIFFVIHIQIGHTSRWQILKLVPLNYHVYIHSNSVSHSNKHQINFCKVSKALARCEHISSFEFWSFSNTISMAEFSPRTIWYSAQSWQSPQLWKASKINSPNILYEHITLHYTSNKTFMVPSLCFCIMFKFTRKKEKEQDHR